jgi:DNA invertase Pin-like site-specific DNA recombinase
MPGNSVRDPHFGACISAKALQRNALKDAGCKRIYEEKVSGAKRSRPELIGMLDRLRAGDVVVVSRLDRLARSTRDVLDIAEQLATAEAGLRSLHEPWADTTSPAGRTVLTIFSGIAEFERDLVRERTRARLAAPRRKESVGIGAKASSMRKIPPGANHRKKLSMPGCTAPRAYRRRHNTARASPL